MKMQRLTAIDIKILTDELNELVTGRQIKDISATPQAVIFNFDDCQLAYIIQAGCPYMIQENLPISGRKYFRNAIGGRVEKISQVNDDRLLLFEIIAFDRLGVGRKRRLYFEFYSNGNIILTDEDDIIRGSFRKTSNKMVGAKYEPSRPEGLNILALSSDRLLTIREYKQIGLLNLFPYRRVDDDFSEKLPAFLAQITGHPDPHTIFDTTGNIIGYAISGPPYIDGVKGMRCHSLLEAITKYVRATSLKQGKAEFSFDYGKQLKKALAKLESIRNELQQTEMAGSYRQYGEIILANLKEIKKGQKSIRCANPYSDKDEFVEIPLEPALTAEKNAENYFNLARRLETSVAILKKRFEAQRHKFEELKKTIESPPPSTIPKTRENAVREKPAIKLPFRQIDLPDGWRLYIGKSAQANDELTFSFARKDDIWFHAWQAAGSHVVLRRPRKGEIPSKHLLLQAAGMAAYFSKAKTSSKVPVIYTEVRHVRKIRGAAGKVSVTNEKQVMVKPQAPEKPEMT